MNNFAISRFGEYYLPSINRQTFETLDSKTLYNQKFKTLFTKPDTLNIIIGMDSGLLASYVLEQSQIDGTKFIFIELPEVLPLLLIDIPKAQQNFIQVIGETEFSEILTQEDIQLFIAKGQYQIYASLGAASQHIEAYTLLFNRLERLVKQHYFDTQTSFTQKIFIKAQLANIADNRQAAKLLKNTFSGKTCIVIAGGPSLDENITWIKDNRDNLFIFAVSRIAEKLLNSGIIADIVASVDPQDVSFDVSRGVFNLSQQSLLVNSYHVSPKILSQWSGMSLYLGQRFPWDDSDKDNIITLGPTVTNSAIRLAIEMGFARILLSGVDLCYSKTGYTHAQGTIEASLGPNLGHNTLWTETYAGEMVETLPQLLHAAQAIEEEALTYPNVRLINLASSAAKITGVDYISTQNLQLAPFEKQPLHQLIPKAQPLAIELARILQDCTQQQKQFKKLLKLTSQALTLTKKLTLNAQTANNLLMQIDAIEHQINAQYPTLAKLIKFYGYYEFSHFLTTKSTKDWNQAHINQMSIAYYQAFNSNCHALLDLVNCACDKINFRLSELTDAPLAELAKTWIKEDQVGRYAIWQRQHSDKILTEDEQIIIEELAQRFEHNLTQVNQGLINHFNKSKTMDRVYKKIMLQFVTQNSIGLIRLAESLDTFIANDDEAKRLYHLALSLHYNLEKHPEKALNALQTLPARLQTEMELKHIILLALKLNNLSLAADTLSQIINHSDEYMPQYAHILRLQGNIQASVNIYLDYLEKYPNDVQTWIKLGLFMLEIKQLEASHTAFVNAVDADPDNQLAQNYLAELKLLISNNP